MNKRMLFAAALAVSASIVLFPIKAVRADTKTVVLVHGAFADGSAWNKVVPLLRDRGLNAISVQLPLSSLADDVAFTQRAISDAGGEVVLVGHSWGGVVITEAGATEQVTSMVYLSAFAPKKGQHIHDLLGEMHGERGIAQVPGLANPIADEQGYLSLSEEDIVKYFAPDIPNSEAQLIAVSQGKIHATMLDQAPNAQAWADKPTWYIVAANDQIIAPGVQRAMAEEIDAKVTELASGHVGMLSMPEEVAKVILESAQ